MGADNLLSHILSVQEGVASYTLETPDVPLRVQRNQCLAFNDLLPTAGAFCKWFQSEYIKHLSHPTNMREEGRNVQKLTRCGCRRLGVVGAVGSGRIRLWRWTGSRRFHRRRWRCRHDGDLDAFLTENFFARKGHSFPGRKRLPGLINGQSIKRSRLSCPVTLHFNSLEIPPTRKTKLRQTLT